MNGTLAILKKKHWWIVMVYAGIRSPCPTGLTSGNVPGVFLSSASWIPAAVHVQALIHSLILNLLLSLSPSDLFKKHSTSITDLTNTDRKHYNLTDTCSHFSPSFILLPSVSGLCLLSFERKENVTFSSVEKIMLCWCVWVECEIAMKTQTRMGGTDDGERGVSCDMTKLLRQVGRCVSVCCCYW